MGRDERRQPSTPAPVRLTSHGPEETERLGERLASALRPGDVLLLEGPFGAGKTRFVQGLARGLGIDEYVTSPSFVIVQEYHGRLPLYHIDLYRLERLDRPTRDLLAEYFDGDGVTVVEWPAALPEEWRRGATIVRFTIAGDETRTLDIHTPHPRLIDALRGAEVGADGPSGRHPSGSDQ